ncbi:LHFPL tetraspan subfamily member 6 protein [Strongylocentrotus purpuratus]|uniref:Lipoma HMGIC fusion partner-like 2 protein n=1 Tax=Strongylocentrotus purpuratus TaxID=7668 RepID=A0A7M7NKC8_STRPU|nr:LHFPL tetraspan subfamily member 6 protein [Strongylocentrotus purpuratus]
MDTARYTYNSIGRTHGYPISMRSLEPGTYIKRSAASLASSHRCGTVGAGSHAGLASRDRLGNVPTTMTISFGLTAVGILWSIVSIVATMASSIGLFMPYWMRGHMFNGTLPVHFGVFRRCNYPTAPNNYVFDCGHYTTFGDIPTLTWKICTIVIGLACIASMFVGLTSLLACCMRDLVTRKVGKVCGAIQFVAALLIAVGCVLYPNGWSHIQVKEACGGTSAPFNLGECTLDWAFYLTASSCVALLLASLLSIRAGATKMNHYGI